MHVQHVLCAVLAAAATAAAATAATTAATTTEQAHDGTAGAVRAATVTTTPQKKEEKKKKKTHKMKKEEEDVTNARLVAVDILATIPASLFIFFAFVLLCFPVPGVQVQILTRRHRWHRRRAFARWIHTER